MPNMNMKYLRSFVAMVEEKSSAKAARRLGLPRQSVTQHVAAVERAVGRRLLETAWPREPRQVGRTQLTDCGLAFFPKAARAVRAHDALFDDGPAEPDPRDARLAVLHGLLELALDAARNNLTEPERQLVDGLLLDARLQGGGVPAGRLRRGDGPAAGCPARPPQPAAPRPQPSLRPPQPSSRT